MPAAPARHTGYTPSPQRPDYRSTAALERRRRRRHLARRRRDLLEDTFAALVGTIVVITLAAGLGVVALIEIPVALALTVSYLLDRRARRR